MNNETPRHVVENAEPPVEETPEVNADPEENEEDEDLEDELEEAEDEDGEPTEEGQPETDAAPEDEDGEDPMPPKPKKTKPVAKKKTTKAKAKKPKVVVKKGKAKPAPKRGAKKRAPSKRTRGSAAVKRLGIKLKDAFTKGACAAVSCSGQTDGDRNHWCAKHRDMVRAEQLKIANRSYRKRAIIGEAGHNVVYRGKPTEWAKAHVTKALALVKKAKSRVSPDELAKMLKVNKRAA